MVKCSNCGFDLPEDAFFCPNCGTPVRRIVEIQKAPENIWRSVRLSLIGTFLSIIISSIIAVAAEGFDPYFIPTFISALIIIYMSGTKSLRDALIISTLIYLVTEAILSGIFLGTLYTQGIKLSAYYSMYYGDAPTLTDVILYSISPITAVLAGFIGYKISLRREVSYERLREEPSPTLFSGIKGSLKKFKYVFLGFFIKSKLSAEGR